MWSQNSSVLTQTTKSQSFPILTTNQASCKEQQHQYRSTTPVIHHSTLPACGNISMTTGGGISSSNSVATQQKSTTSTLQSCSNIASSTTLNTLSKASTISSTARHSNGNLSTLSNNNNSTTHSINNNKANSTNDISNNNNSNNEGNKNQNPNWTKLQTLEQRKLELEKLLNEKNWLLQQIHKQEAQILNGNYEQFHLFETSKAGAIILPNGGTVVSGATNSILRRKGSSSLKLSKSNVHFNGKNNRLTLSKSEYDLAQENKHNNQTTTTIQHGTGIKKRQGPPHKTNSFHDSTSASSLSLTKPPSFEYNGNNTQVGGLNIGSNVGSHSIKYSISRPQHGSSENLISNHGVTQCDKYYLSPTSQMYTDGNGFIRASQNIKQCLSPFPMHKVVALNDTEAHRTSKQQLHSTSAAQARIHHNGSQPHPESYESVDALSLSPTSSFAYDQGQHMLSKHLNLWRTLSSSDRSAWCDNSSYLQLEADGINHSSKPSAKKGPVAATSGPSMQSTESPSLGGLFPVGGLLVSSHTIEKSCDEVSISSVNSETSKKPKNKQWMESSLDGPIIRPNIVQTTAPDADCNPLWPTMSPMRGQMPQYSLYNMGRQPALSSEASGSVTPSPAPAALNTSRPPTRTLNHHAHSHHKQGYRERTKLSSQSMSSGSYRAPKAKLDDDNGHLSHSTSFLNVDAYQNNHFHLPPQQQQQQSQFAHHNHYHLEVPSSGTSFTGPAQPLQHQQKPLNITMPSLCQPQQQTLPKASPTMQKPCDDLVGTIRYATSVATQPSRLCNPSQAITKNTLGSMQKAIPPNSLPINHSVQLSPQANIAAATSPDIRIESPKNMTVVQQATFLPYKEITKPFEMSDFYKYSTKFRQKEANAATLSKHPT